MDAEGFEPMEMPYWGSDLHPERRPGVPREAPPHLLPGTHWIEPPRQPLEGRVLRHAGIIRPTPVFSTALPPKGASGALRRAAYRVPDHHVSHWLLLLVADRGDVLEHLPSYLMGRVFRATRLRSRRPAPEQRAKHG